MTSREIVTRAIEYGGPERMAKSSDLFGGSDFHHVSLETPSYVPRKPGYAEWGYTMAHSEIPNNGMPEDVPIATWDMLESYKWPDAHNDERYKSIPGRLAMPEAGEKYVHMGWFVGLFDMVYRLHEFEDCMRDFILEPALMKHLIGKVAEFIVGAIGELAARFPGRIHGLLIPDDWAGQDATFVSVGMWREFFGEHYRRIGEHLHRAGMHFWLHSDGRINALIPTLIECGVDVINMPSPHVVGIDEVAREFGGRICFFNGVDIQTTLVEGSDEEIEREAKELVEKWNRPEGGFIPSGGLEYVAGGVSRHRGLAATNAFRKYCWGLGPLTEGDLK